MTERFIKGKRQLLKKFSLDVAVNASADENDLVGESAVLLNEEASLLASECLLKNEMFLLANGVLAILNR